MNETETETLLERPAGPGSTTHVVDEFADGTTAARAWCGTRVPEIFWHHVPGENAALCVVCAGLLAEA